MPASGILKGIRIAGMACAIPDNAIPNEAYLGRFGEGVAKFSRMTGIKARYQVVPGTLTAADLALLAAKDLHEQGMLDPATMDAVIFVSQTPDYVLPSTACVLQHRLSLPKQCLAFDINLGCSGFVYGLFVAASLAQTLGAKRVLLLGGDTISTLVSEEDKSAAMLFGDGGFAVVLEAEKDAPEWHYSFCTQGANAGAIIVPAGAARDRTGNRQRRPFGEGMVRGDHELYMDGTEVFTFTISEIPATLKSLMAEAGTTPDGYDLLVLHQANLFILKQIAMQTGFPMAKVPVSMDRYGNTSVTSIPLTLCDALAGKDMPPRRLLLAGFGVGLSWGCIDLVMDPTRCLPVKLVPPTPSNVADPYAPTIQPRE